MMFLQADTGGEGGGAGDVSRGSAAFDAPKQTTAEHEPPSRGPERAETPEEAPETPKPAAESFDPARFAKEFGETLGTQLKPIIDKQAQPQMTPEEARRLLNVWEPDDGWYAQYDNLDTRKDAVAAMRDALMTQADTLAQMRMQEMLGAFRDEISPQLAAVRAYADQQRDERFTAKYPQLGNPALRPLIMAVADDMARQNKRFQNEEEAFTALASGVEAVIKVNNPEFKLETAGTGPPQNNGRGRTGIPAMTPGAGGGTGRSAGTQKADKPRGIAVFDKV